MGAITGVLLAAGQGRRFGSQKLLASLPDGEPLGLKAARNLLAVLPRVVAVMRPGEEQLDRQLAALGCRVVVTRAAEEGMGRSLAVGVAAEPDASGWLIALADMPWIRVASIRAVVEALEAGAAVAAPTYAGRRGHPVGFARRWQSHLQGLTGDRGARALIEAAGADLVLVSTADPGILQDVDYPSDLTLGH